MIFLLTLPLFGCPSIGSWHTANVVHRWGSGIAGLPALSLRNRTVKDKGKAIQVDPTSLADGYSDAMICSLLTDYENGTRSWKETDNPDTLRLMGKRDERELTLEKCDSALNTLPL